MRRLPTFLVCIAAVALFVVFEAVPEAETKEVQLEEAPLSWQQVAQDDGKELYAELCAVCHGADGKGNGPAAPALKTPAPDLTTLALHNGGVFPEAEIKKTVDGRTAVTAHGTSEMPVWGRALFDVRPDRKPGQREGFAQLRIYNLVSYLESIQESE